MDIVFRLAKFLQGGTLKLFADWQVEGSDYTPPMGPLIVVANHQSNFDPSLLATSLPRRIRFLAKQEIFRNPLASWFLGQYGAFPLNRHSADTRALRWALDQLDGGQAIVLFPEGTRSRGGIKKAHPGVASVALKSGAPILPVGMTGTEKLGSVTRVFNPTGQLRVNVGRVFSLPPIEGRPSRELLESMTDMIMERIAVLLPPSYQGVYGDRARGAALETAAPAGDRG